jgi:hypothetical protein
VFLAAVGPRVHVDMAVGGTAREQKAGPIGVHDVSRSRAGHVAQNVAVHRRGPRHRKSLLSGRIYTMGEGNAADEDRLVLPGPSREQELVEPGALLSVTPIGLAVEKAEGRSQCHTTKESRRYPQS